MLEFLVVGPDGRGPRHRMTLRPLTLGREPSCDVVVADEAVSRQHALVWMRDGEGWIQDLRSRNGTFVNDARIASATWHQVVKRTQVCRPRGPQRSPARGARCPERLSAPQDAHPSHASRARSSA